MAFDDLGNLYAVNNGNNTVERLTSTGIGSVFANSDLNSPRYLAFNLVPEPSTWILLFIGAVALGWRRRAAAARRS